MRIYLRMSLHKFVVIEYYILEAHFYLTISRLRHSLFFFKFHLSLVLFLAQEKSSIRHQRHNVCDRDLHCIVQGDITKVIISLKSVNDIYRISNISQKNTIFETLKKKTETFR